MNSLQSGRKGKRVAIIGAGPGGLSAGIALHQAGFDVKIFERHETIKPLGGAIILNAIGINILRSYGVKANDMALTVVQRFRKFDGRERVFQKVDPNLLQKANVSGWMAGIMRSDLYERMLKKIPEGMIIPNCHFKRYEESDEEIKLYFENEKTYTADLLIGADGINSRVRQQLWGRSELKHLGIAVWLGWAEVDGPREEIVLHHSDVHQFGFAPLIYQGKDCYEWWFVEACQENQPEPKDIVGYVKERVNHFVTPVPDIINATKPENLFRWVVKFRDPLDNWSKGRVTILGDAAHPTSPYAAYGAGMAIEDGYFLGKYLENCNLSDIKSVQDGLSNYDKERVKYTNNVTSFARTLGRIFHNYPKPIRMLRDFLFDYTKIPNKQINKSMTEEATMLLNTIIELESKSKGIKQTS